MKFGFEGERMTGRIPTKTDTWVIINLSGKNFCVYIWFHIRAESWQQIYARFKSFEVANVIQPYEIYKIVLIKTVFSKLIFRNKFRNLYTFI